jgi:hypothetical protein
MAYAALVESDVTAGRRLVETLDTAKFPMFAALWLLQPDADEWHLWIGSMLVDAVGRQRAYSQLQTALLDSENSIPFTSIYLVGSSDSTLARMGMAFSIGGLSEVRLRDNVINGVLIPDALVYRLERPPLPTITSAKTKRPTPTSRTGGAKAKKAKRK